MNKEGCGTKQCQ